MAKQLEFRTVEEFRRHYFPNQAKKEEMERIMKSGKFGEYLAKKLIETARRNLRLYNLLLA